MASKQMGPEDIISNLGSFFGVGLIIGTIICLATGWWMFFIPLVVTNTFTGLGCYLAYVKWVMGGY